MLLHGEKNSQRQKQTEVVMQSVFKVKKWKIYIQITAIFYTQLKMYVKIFF